MKKLITLLILQLSILACFAQVGQGALKMTITEKDNGLPIPFANVIVKDTNGTMVTGSQSDFDGKVDIRPIPAGTYDVEVRYVGYRPVVIKRVIIQANQTTTIPKSQTQLIISLQELSIVECSYSLPSIKQDAASTSSTFNIRRISVGQKNSSYPNCEQKGLVNSRIEADAISKMPVRCASESSLNGGATLSFDHATTTIVLHDGKENLRVSHDNGYYSQKSEIEVNEVRNVFQMQRESYEYYAENAFENVFDKPLSTFSIDVDNGSYTNARRIINTGYLPPMASVRMEEFINYFPYQRIKKDNEHPFITDTELGVCPWNSEHHLLKVTLQADDVKMEDAPVNNLVFLIDVSGSMSSHDKLDLVKRAFTLLVDQLGEDDRISIVTYAGASAVLLEGEQIKNADKIKRAIEDLQSGGGTHGSQGIITAYELAERFYVKHGNNRVILATDGDFNIGVSDNKALISLIEEKRSSGVFLTTLGFGTGNYMDDRMEQLADHGNGSYMYVDTYQEARKVFLKEITGTLITVAKDVKFQIEFNPKKVASYRLLGYENRVLADKDFIDDTKDAGELGAGQMVTAFYELVPVREDAIEDSVDTETIDKRYQKPMLTVESETDEMFFLKLRYKKPDQDQSILIEEPISLLAKQEFELSENFVMGAAIVEFALILRQSEYKENASLSHVQKAVNNSLLFDPEGHRREFLTLVEMVDEMYDTASK